jgi:hypothetical protein
VVTPTYTPTPTQPLISTPGFTLTVGPTVGSTLVIQAN